MARSRNIGRGKNPNSHNIQKNKLAVGGKGQASLNRAEKEEMLTNIIRWCCEGHSKGQVKELVQRNSPAPLSDSVAYQLISVALERLSEITNQEAESVIAIHLEWYEKIYAYFEKIDNTAGSNKAMRAKEKLLGLHKETNKVVVNETRTVIINREVEYDTSKLTNDQKMRLQQLIEKTK